MEDLTLVTEEKEYEPVSSESTPELTTVQCPICGDTIDIPQYNAVSRSDALKKHIEEEHGDYRLHNPDGFGLSNFHTLMLHSVPHLYGSPGIVVNEERAKATPCRCIEYKPGKKLCFSPGIVGALSDEQEMVYCKGIEKLESPALKERMEKWQTCVTKSKETLPPTNGATRLEIFLSSMSECLAGNGTEV